MGAGVVEDADDGGVAAGEDAGDAAGAAAVAAAGRLVDEDFVALHGAVELVGRDEEVVVAVGAAVGADEAEAVAVEVEAAGDEAVAGGAIDWLGVGGAGWAGGLFRGGGGEGPLLGVELDEVAAGGDAGELLEQEAALAAAAEAELADELFVAGAAAGGALDAADELAVGVRVGGVRHAGLRILLWRLWVVGCGCSGLGVWVRKVRAVGAGGVSRDSSASLGMTASALEQGQLQQQLQRQGNGNGKYRGPSLRSG